MYIETKQQSEKRMLIIETIEDVVGVPRELWEIKRSKSKSEVMIRDIYIKLLHDSKMFTLENIARIVGLKNHCTVLQSLDRTSKWSETETITEHLVLTEVLQEYEQRNN